MKEARMRVFLVAIVAMALLASACSGGSQFRRYRVYGFDWTGGVLDAGDTVVCDFYAQGEMGGWVKVADDVPWPDVTVDLWWPVPPADPWPLPGDHSSEQMRVDVQAMIGGEPYEYSCLMDWDSWQAITVQCEAVEE